MTKFFKSKQKKSSNPVPRDIKEIQANYADLCARTGQVQHQLRLLNRQLENLNQSMDSVTYEAQAREQLDKQNAVKVQQPPVETSQQ